MQQLRKPTIAERITVSLQAELVVAPELEAPAGANRRVRLLTPPAPLVAISVDHPTPTEAGPGRAFFFVNLPPSQIVAIWLQPSQSIYALVVPGAGGYAQLGYICEFFDEEAPV